MTAPPEFNHQVRVVAEALAQENVTYLLIGKGGAIIHGFPDTTQDTDIFVLKSAKNSQALVRAARKIGFDLSETEEREIHAGKDFVQLRNGPFDLDVIFSPDGIDSFEKAWRNGRDIDGYKVCSLDDIIASKKSANRTKDRESLARLDDFRQYLQIQGRSPGKPLPPLPTTSTTSGHTFAEQARRFKPPKKKSTRNKQAPGRSAKDRTD